MPPPLCSFSSDGISIPSSRCRIDLRYVTGSSVPIVGCRFCSISFSSSGFPIQDGLVPLCLICSRQKFARCRRCEHYRRRCKIVAPCCNQVFPCRHCHNEATVSLFLFFFRLCLFFVVGQANLESFSTQEPCSVVFI